MQASYSNKIWESLFQGSWGGVVFPTEPSPVIGLGLQRKQAELSVVFEQLTGLPPQLPSVSGVDIGQSALSPLTDGRASLTDSSGGRSQPPPDNLPRISVPTGDSGDDASSVDWRSRYRDQALFVRAMQCPRCGLHGLVPILYGFPSPPLMEARKARKMILGGDHLIEVYLM